MTAEPLLPPITCPTSLIGSCAPLLGFVPQRCLVAFIHGVPGRHSPVIVRMDLPGAEHAETLAAELALSIAGTGGSSVDVVAWVEDRDESLLADLSSNSMLSALARHLDLLGVVLGADLSTNGRVWWTHACQDPYCCPGESVELDPSVLSAVQAEFVYAGYAPLASRAELAQRIARDTGRAQRVRTALDKLPPAVGNARWRDGQIRTLSRMLLPKRSCTLGTPNLSPTAAARLIRGLEDIRVRDVVLHRLVVGGRDCDACWAVTVDTLVAAVRWAPPGTGAPVATILGLISWLRGEGALATLCVERAFEEDPAYRLAGLTRELMSRGTDPRLWRSSLAGLPESECRDPSGR